MDDKSRISEFNELVEAEAKALGLIEVEEEKLPEGNNEEKSSEEASKKPEREYTELEKEQMALGWDPNKEGGVDAKEFKRVGEIMDAKRAASKRADAASKEVQELKQTVKQLVDHTRKLQASRYDKELQDLDLERDERIALGDVDAVKQLNLKEKVLEKAKEAELIETPKGPDPYAQRSPVIDSYVERNSFWMNGQTEVDKKMQILANKVIDYLKEAEPNISEEQAVKFIEDEVKSKFPTRFDNPNKEKAPLVMKSTSSGSKVSSKSLLSELPHKDQRTFADIKKVDPSYTEKEFLELLENTRG